MTVTDVPGQQADALVAEIQRKVALAAREVMDAAAREAAAIRQSARDKARRQLDRVRVELRQTRERHLAQATAENDAAARRRTAASARELLAVGWPLLEKALEARWHEAGARTRWIEAVLDAACARLQPGAWVVRVPADLDAAGHQALRNALVVRGAAEAVVERDGALRAGLSVESAGATLDATVRALLADRAEVEAMLLAAAVIEG